MTTPLAENLKEVRKGHFVRPEHVNAFVRAAKVSNSFDTDGYADAAGLHAFSARFKASRRWSIAFTTQDIPQYALFGVIAGQATATDPVQFNIAQITQNASSLAFFTNDAVEGHANAQMFCHPVDMWDPVLITVTGTATSVGMPCGPDPNAMGVSGDRFGLVCLSVPDSNNRVWVMRSPDPLGVMGQITTSDVTSFNAQTNTLGTGFIAVFKRTTGGSIVAATDPSGNPFVLPVWSLKKSTIKQGTFVQANCTMNVGLLIADSPASLTLGKMEVTSIGHNTSNTVSLLSGSTAGAEQLTGEEVQAYNLFGPVAQNERVLLTPSSDPNVPYYIVNNEWGGKLLGQTQTDLKPGQSGSINVWGGALGGEVVGPYNVTVCNKLLSVVPKNTFVLVETAGTNDAPGSGGWYIAAAQRAGQFTGRVAAQALQGNVGFVNNGWAASDSTVKVEIFFGANGQNIDSNILVDAINVYSVIYAEERCHIEWNGDVFIITRAECDGIAVCQLQAGNSIATRSYGNVIMYFGGTPGQETLRVISFKLFNRYASTWRAPQGAPKIGLIGRNREAPYLITGDC